MSFDVLKVQSRLGIQDPDFNYTRHHTAIFVQTDADGGGHILDVTGDLVTGMRYQNTPGGPPEASDTFHAKQHLGRILAANYPAAVDTLLNTIPPPPKQKVFDPATKSYVRCKPDGSLYDPGETVPPLMKCTEWTEQGAIPALIQAGLLRT